MGKYKVEVTYTRTSTKVFEVEASCDAGAIALADEAAANFDFNQVSSFGEHHAQIMKRPSEDKDLNAGDKCPKCGGTIIDGPNKLECFRCGRFY